ncbi:MAG: EAL domain-containing protein [Gammaproteobacteria bacterium]|nr:EAL domain-containing protein [Gammaproteobacteria bacterium]MDE1984759.1 EAL domain-containing protein [Gammaproteobacteria bacterium]MDE2460388.1 EAL domain-containing protein [Gammaproteobacteria bacterium]
MIITASQNEAEQLNSALRSAGYPVQPLWASDVDSAEKNIKAQRPDLILCSMSVPSASFQDIVKLRDMSLPNVPIIALSDTTDPELVAEIIDSGARDLVSITQTEHVRAVVTRELEVLQLARELEQKGLTLKEYEQRISLVMRDTKNAIAYAHDGILLNVNPAFLELFGYSASGQLEGQPVLELFGGESQLALKEALKLAAKGQAVKPLPLGAKHAEGNLLEITLQIARAEFEGEPALELSIRNDNKSNEADAAMLAQAQAQSQVQIDLLTQKLAASVQQLTTARNLDMLTGFINRMHFIEVLRQELAKHVKSAVRVLLYIKPDQFSLVMDKVGVIASDGIIKGLADLVRTSVAKDDIVARFGGTVFAVIMTRHKLKEITDWTEKFHTTVAARIFESMGKSTSMSCSIGYVLLDEHNRDAEQALVHAKEAHTKASLSEGGSVVAWMPAKVDSQGKTTETEWKRSITDALKTNRFMLAYQSIASLMGDATEALDMLVRMRDEDNNEIPNKDFLPAAERCGMMVAIDRWVVERSLRMLEERTKQNRAARLFVRLSDQSLTDKNLLPWLEKLLSGVFFSAGHLVFQISEKSAEKYITDTRALAEAAHRLQCGFALEHFGLGQNPLHTLGLIRHVDYIKIDGSLIAVLATEEDKRNLVKKFVGRAGELKIHTVAEKVEKPETMAMLYQLGIESIQGNYVQEPEVVMADSAPSPATAG